MRKQRKDTTRGYKINFATNTLTLNYKFADAAFNDYGSPEYERMKANIYRSVTCGDLREDHIGQEVRLAGWVENIRDHGGVSFIDLRDMYGVMQVVLRDAKLLEGITREEAISVEGLIEHRDEEYQLA